MLFDPESTYSLAELLSNLSFKEATALFPHKVQERCNIYSFILATKV